MPKLSNMLGETGQVEIECPGDEPLIVVYRRGSLTPRLQAHVADAQRAAQRASAAGEPPPNEAIMAMVDIGAVSWVSWNLKDADDVVIPIDVEHLSDVAFFTLNLIWTEIGRQKEVDPLSGNGSSNGSSPTAGSEPHPITTAS